MFIGISVAYFTTSTVAPDAYVMRYFDASRIVMISPARLEGHVEFSVDDGGYEGPSVFVTDSYDCGGLVEAIIQCRMHPAEWLPSRNVGKPAKAEAKDNSVQWSAQDREK
jgi:hypothetical protein